MDNKKLEYFRSVLQEEMRSLLEEAEKTVSEMTADTTTFPDPNDRATQESDRTFELRIRDRERKLPARGHLGQPVVDLVDAVHRRELRHLRNEFVVVQRIKRVLVAKLRR